MKWAGLVTNASPYSIPVGAAVTQVNLQILSPGQLNVRPGNASVSFASVTATTDKVVSAFRYPSTTDAVIYQDAAGKILVARGPS